MSRESPSHGPFQYLSPRLTLKGLPQDLDLFSEGIQSSASESPLVEDTQHNSSDESFRPQILTQDRNGPPAFCVRHSIPTLHSNAALDRYLTYDGSIGPANPHNTLVYSESTSDSSEIDTCDERYDALNPNAENITLGFKDGLEQSYAAYIANDSKKAQRQHKASIPTDTGLRVRSPSENVPHTPNTSSPKSREETTTPPGDPSPRFVSPPRMRFIGPRAVGQKLEYNLADRQNTLREKSKPVRRYHPQRPQLNRTPERTYHMPIDDSDKPFPAPIPTIHNLPLRPRNESQQLIDSDASPQDLNNTLPTGEPKRKTNLKHAKGLILFLPRKLLIWKKLKEFAVVSFSLHESQSSMQSSPSGYKSYEINVRMSWSITSIEYLQTNSNKQVPKSKPATPVKSAPVPVLLQVNLIIPALLLRIIQFIDTAIRSSVFPAIWSTTNGFANAVVSFIIVAVLWLLKGLRTNSVYMESGLGGH